MFTIRRRENETNDKLIKRFINKTKKLKIIEQCVDRLYHKKKSTIRREKKVNRERLIEKNKNKEKER
jgi:ribosomal protein S21